MDSDSKLTAWAATQPADNYVYRMECGHEYDSSFRRAEGVFVPCSAHGSQRLISGPFREPAGFISDACLYGDCDCDLPGCMCECHGDGCDHDHPGWG